VAFWKPLLGLGRRFENCGSLTDLANGRRTETWIRIRSLSLRRPLRLREFLTAEGMDGGKCIEKGISYISHPCYPRNPRLNSSVQGTWVKAVRGEKLPLSL
jgi:hypothetical protein